MDDAAQAVRETCDPQNWTPLEWHRQLLRLSAERDTWRDLYEAERDRSELLLSELQPASTST